MVKQPLPLEEKIAWLLAQSGLTNIMAGFMTGRFKAYSLQAQEGEYVAVDLTGTDPPAQRVLNETVYAMDKTKGYKPK